MITWKMTLRSRKYMLSVSLGVSYQKPLHHASVISSHRVDKSCLSTKILLARKCHNCHLCILYGSCSCGRHFRSSRNLVGAAKVQRVETVWNWRIQFIDINLFPISSGASECASERTNERSGARKPSEQRRESEWLCSACKYEQRSEWPSTLRDIKRKRKKGRRLVSPCFIWKLA